MRLLKKTLFLPLLFFASNAMAAIVVKSEEIDHIPVDIAAIGQILGADSYPGGNPSVTIKGERSVSVAFPLSLGMGTGLGGGRISGGGGRGKKASPPAHNNSNKEQEAKDPCKSTGNPVVIATGEKHKDELDFQSAGLYGLSLTRTYRSMHATGGMFGPHWLSSLDAPRLTAGACFTPNPKWGCIPASYRGKGHFSLRRQAHYRDQRAGPRDEVRVR